MMVEGRVLGCDACRELRIEEINRNNKSNDPKAQSKPQAARQSEKNKNKSVSENRKSVTHRKKLLPGGRIEGEPEWWGSGVNRVISVGPGDKCVEEVEQDICERTYAARTQKALEDRGSWADFLRMMNKKYSEAMSKNLGPDWFQDLSPRQTGLIDKLSEILEADMQEGITSRTRRTLNDIGIHPPLPKRDVARCMHECLSNIIRFLFLIHKVVVDREQGPYEVEFEEAAKDERTIPTYSINERLLLSGVFHLHFEEFTSKLDKLLPPPPEKPKIVLPRKPPPEPKKKYKSPYLEPLPIPAKVWYEQRVEDEIYAKQAALVVLQEKREFEEKVLREAEEQKRAKDEKLRKLLMQKNYFGTSKSLKRTLDSSPTQVSIPRRENKSQIFRRVTEDKRKKSLGASEINSDRESASKSSLSISKSLQHVRKNRRYMYDVVHETIQTKTSFGGFFDNDNKLIKDSEGANLKIRIIPRNEKVVCLYRDEEFKPVQILDTRVRICCRDVGMQTDAEPMFLPIDISPELEFYRLMESIRNVSEAYTNTEASNEEGKVEDVVEEALEELPNLNDEKPLNVECVDEKCALVEGDVPMDEFVMMRKKIELYPPEKQLKVAVAFLCRRGDPMAVLPRVDETPWLQRWFELRRGIKDKLTAEEKEELLNISQRLWAASYRRVSGVTTKPFRIRRKVTTLDKEWLMKKINDFKNEFQSRLRQQLVNNSREYFPTFFIEYFTSPLNRSLRKTFFTYLSSKEMDSYVYKVWNMECKDMTIKKDKKKGNSEEQPPP